MPQDLKTEIDQHKAARDGKDGEGDYLEGQLLIAMPAMADPNFERSVVYLCAHSDQGAVGLVINQRALGITFPEILEQMDIAMDVASDRPIMIGGPVETGRGFVLHTTDYCKEDATLVTQDNVGMTATVDILKAIARGDGPRQALLAIGYSGWGPGQLELEIQGNGWLTCPAESGLVFDDDFDSKWERAIEILGVDPAFLSSDFGHA